MRTMIVAVVLGLPLVLAASSTSATDFSSIQTPSGNIHCQFSSDQDGQLDCEIIAVTASEGLPIRPADCDLEWGQRFVMGATGEAQLACTGDTLRNPDASVVPYGGTIALYGMTCVSETAGLTCTNDDGHGFFLSKARQELY